MVRTALTAVIAGSAALLSIAPAFAASETAPAATRTASLGAPGGGLLLLALLGVAAIGATSALAGFLLASRK